VAGCLCWPCTHLRASRGSLTISRKRQRGSGSPRVRESQRLPEYAKRVARRKVVRALAQQSDVCRSFERASAVGTGRRPESGFWGGAQSATPCKQTINSQLVHLAELVKSPMLYQLSYPSTGRPRHGGWREFSNATKRNYTRRRGKLARNTGFRKNDSTCTASPTTPQSHAYFSARAPQSPCNKRRQRLTGERPESTGGCHAAHTRVAQSKGIYAAKSLLEIDVKFCMKKRFLLYCFPLIAKK
jgi:hypothetical protein